MHHIFAHGALRKGQPDSRHLAGANLLGCAETIQEYALCLMNKKPLVTKRPLSTIKGDVYAVSEDMLMLVDRLEGHPRANKRELVNVRLEDGSEIEAWLYFHIHPMRNSVFVESGDYTQARLD